MNANERILDMAEQLFAERGPARTSLRAITAAAEVNLASVHYYFGSKAGLIKAVFERRIKPMNAERLRRLEQLHQRHGEIIPLESLIEAFIAPALGLSRDPKHGGEYFIRILGRTYTDPSSPLEAYLQELHKDVAERFRTAFQSALPQLDHDELYWRLHFLVGTLAYCMSGSGTMRLIASSRLHNDTDTQQLVHRLAVFLRGGLTAATVPHPEQPHVS